MPEQLDIVANAQALVDEAEALGITDQVSHALAEALKLDDTVPDVEHDLDDTDGYVDDTIKPRFYRFNRAIAQWKQRNSDHYIGRHVRVLGCDQAGPGARR